LREKKRAKKRICPPSNVKLVRFFPKSGRKGTARQLFRICGRIVPKNKKKKKTFRGKGGRKPPGEEKAPFKGFPPLRTNGGRRGSKHHRQLGGTKRFVLVCWFFPRYLNPHYVGIFFKRGRIRNSKNRVELGDWF